MGSWLGLGRNVFFVLKHVTLCRGVLFHGTKTERKLDALRSLCLTSQRCGKLQSPREKEEGDDDDEEMGKPIKFSTSKASHRTWSVERSLGSTHKRPLWRVIPISLFCVGFLLWCVFRTESEIDEQFEKQLYERLPGLLEDKDEDEDEDENEEKTKPGS